MAILKPKISNFQGSSFWILVQFLGCFPYQSENYQLASTFSDTEMNVQLETIATSDSASSTFVVEILPS